jgi:hypothetical protein
MKTLLANLLLPKAIGMYVADGEIALSQVLLTPWGPIEIARKCERYEEGQLSAALQQHLVPLLGKRSPSRVPIAVGLPCLHTFFSTRPIQSTSRDPSPHVLLREALQSPGVYVDDMLVDLIKAQPGRRPIASIVACQRKYVTGLLDAVHACGARPVRVEPAPCALLRAAASAHRTPRKAKVVLRIFLGETEGLAALTASQTPLVWRPFGLTRGDEAAALLSTIRSLQTLGKYCGVDSACDAVVIHGRTDLRGLLEFEWLQEQIGCKTQWCDGPSLDHATVALGLAIGGLDSEALAFDLSRPLKPPAMLRDVFPWGEAALQGALLLCLGLFLGQRSNHMKQSYSAVQDQLARQAGLSSQSEQQLERQKKELEQRVSAVRRFLDSRVVWTSYMREIPARLPANTFLTSVQGHFELESSGKEKGGKAKPKKSLVLRCSAAIPPDAAAPHEIDNFLDELRELPVLKKHFPVIELADLKQFQREGDTHPSALFSVVCAPKPSAGKSASHPETPQSAGGGQADHGRQ